MEGKEAFDSSRRIRATQINEGDVVLRHDAKNEQDRSTKRKLLYKWLGPYRVRTALIEKGTYELEEFDGTRVPGTHPGNRLKKFVKRKGFYEPVEDEDEDDEEEEEGDEMNEVEEMGEVEAESEDARAEFKPMDFEIRLPTLTAEQRSQYIRYEEDEDGNIL